MGGGRVWCPHCGDEFREGFDRCSDCGVALVEVRPEPVAPVPEDDPAVPVDHVLLEYNLADWSEDHRRGLALQLRVADIPGAWEGGTVLVVGRAWQRQVDELVDFIEIGTDGDAHDGPVEGGATSIIASPGRRLFGAVVDFFAYGIGWATASPLMSTRPGLLVGVSASAAYWVLPGALWGRSLGKLAVGTKIQRLDGVSPPGWRVALIRWGVVVGPEYVAVLLWTARTQVTFGSTVVSFTWSTVFVSAWIILVFAPILGSSRRGLHDRAAGTEVVLTRVSRDTNDFG